MTNGSAVIPVCSDRLKSGGMGACLSSLCIRPLLCSFRLLQSKAGAGRKVLAENSLLKNIQFNERFLGEETVTESKMLCSSQDEASDPPFITQQTRTCDDLRTRKTMKITNNLHES